MFLDILTAVVMSSLNTDENLHALVLCRMVSLSLEHGNSDASCFAYVTLAMLAGPQFGDYESRIPASASWATIWWRSTDCSAIRRASICVLETVSSPWRRHVKDGTRACATGFRRCEQDGRSYFCRIWLLPWLDHQSSWRRETLWREVQREAEAGLEFASKARFGIVVDILIVHSSR